MVSENEIHEILEVRKGWKSYYLIGFFVWLVVVLYLLFIDGNRRSIIEYLGTNRVVGSLMVVFFILSIPVVCLYQYFDSRVELRISSVGIWTRAHGLIEWSTLIYFYSRQEFANEGDYYTFYFKQREVISPLSPEIRIELRRTDIEFDVIRDRVTDFALRYGIKDLGHTKGWI